MIKYTISACSLAFLLTLTSCGKKMAGQNNQADTIKPVIITEAVKHDTDDPAIWLNPEDPSQSLIIGTDKDIDGALYVFDLKGKIVADKVVRNLKRPNNVDIAYGLMINGKATDIAVVTEREANKIRIFSLPDMKAIDNGGIEVFTGETEQAPMGISMYTRPSDKAIFAVVGRKSGPAEGYLWQYRLSDGGNGNVSAEVVRKFGRYSGKKEIESIAVDNENGYIYYSDEQVGVRKYHADPEMGNNELALIPNIGVTEDNEGISIYKTGEKTGYILVSDQGAGKFQIFPREGSATNPHEHKMIRSVKVTALKSDGSEVTNVALNDQFKKGLFVAMSEGKVFHYYRWEDIIGTDK
jgi:3-phytase